MDREIHMPIHIYSEHISPGKDGEHIYCTSKKCNIDRDIDK